MDTDKSLIDVSKDNKNNTKLSRILFETNDESLSTLSNGTSFISFDSLSIKWNIREAVKGILFHKKPFINDQYELEFSTKEDSVCDMILSHINIPKGKGIRMEYWKQAKEHIPHCLNQKRATIVQTIKKKFTGK